MPAIFPELLPDEMLYSAIARYQEMMCFTSRTAISDVFGSRVNATSLIDLPTRVDLFVERLPPGHSYQAAAVIRDHTTLPYHARFLSAERVEHATSVMLGRRAGNIRQILGTAPSTVAAPTHLNYCEVCRCVDREVFGTAYWHRVHQLPGVFVCPDHAVPLHRTPYQAGYASRNVFRPLEQLPPSGVMEVNSSTAVDPMYLEQIAEDSRWLLTTWGEPLGADALRDHYRALVFATGFITEGGSVRMSNLRTSLTAHYGEAFLEETGCTVTPHGRGKWLRHIFRKSTSYAHPLQYILVARLLGASIRDVLHPESAIDAAPRDGIRSVGTARRQVNTGSPRHVDPTPEWEARLKEMVADPTKSLVAIAAELGVAHLDTVKRHAYRLGVWRDSWKLTENLLPGTRHIIRRQTLRDERQRTWLALRAAHPTLGRMQLAAMRPAVYLWLARHEHGWLDAHSLPKQGRVNWAERDEQALRAARIAVRELLTDPSSARRVTLAGVDHRIGLRARLLVKADRMPRTVAYLRRAAQFRHRWERRRLYRAVMGHLVDRTIPSPYRLTLRASIGRTVRTELRALANTAVDALSRTIEFGEPFAMDWSGPMSPGGERDA